MRVIQMVGGPCSGKSAIASGLFNLMKLRSNFKVELVTEPIKDYMYSNNTEAMDDQFLLTAELNHRIRRLRKKVDFAISDSSLLNGAVYNSFYGIAESSQDFATQFPLYLFEQYDNLVFLLPRKEEYDSYGRSQTLEQAKEIDRLFVEWLNELRYPYIDLRSYTHEEIPQVILDMIINGEV